MNSSVIVGIPIRSLAQANQRLAPFLEPAHRPALARALATHTARVVEQAGNTPHIVSSAPEVTSWATSCGFPVVPETCGPGLDGAARCITSFAQPAPWLILHSDLPCLTSPEVATAVQVVTQGGFLVAPSYDGGTTALGGRGDFPFAYGPGSFHRHLRACPSAQVVVSLGFLLDIDTNHDLETVRNHPRGAWLNQVFTPT